MGKFLTGMFPKHLDLIADLRLIDRDFDQICSEVEEVAALLENRNASHPGPWEALGETLSDLQREIAEYLGAGSGA